MIQFSDENPIYIVMCTRSVHIHVISMKPKKQVIKVQLQIQCSHLAQFGSYQCSAALHVGWASYLNRRPKGTTKGLKLHKLGVLKHYKNMLHTLLYCSTCTCTCTHSIISSTYSKNSPWVVTFSQLSKVCMRNNAVFSIH